MLKIKRDALSEIERKEISSAQEEFLTSCKLRNLSSRTLEFYREDTDYFIRCSNIKYADEITHDVVDAFVLHEMNKGNKTTAINTRIRGLRVFIRFCGDKEYLEPFKYQLLKVDQDMKEPYTDEELKLLLKKPKSESWSEWRTWAIINTLLATGVRVTTLVNIRIKDIDMKQKTLFLQKLKNRKQQVIPISTSLKSVLQLYFKLWDWKQDDYLFPSISKNQMHTHTVELAVRRYNKARGVNKTSLHLFRHTFAKNYILAGGGMVQLQAILGHSTLDMTRRYVNLYGNDIQRDFDVLNPLNNIMKNN